ncbi:MAG: nitrate reductase subunit beta, partial [Armatimonadota bacterium]
ACVGRIRYVGGLLYDADRIVEAVQVEDEALVQAQRDIILDPFRPDVIAAARANGIDEGTLKYVQGSPVYEFVKRWRIALPLHSEFRTLPMLFYVPPLQPVMATVQDGIYESFNEEMFGSVDQCRTPIRYLGRLLGGGNDAEVRYALRKVMAVRVFKRMQSVGDVDSDKVKTMMAELDADADELEAIYRLTSLATLHDRYVIPPSHRELTEEQLYPRVSDAPGQTGLGFVHKPVRGT